MTAGFSGSGLGYVARQIAPALAQFSRISKRL